MKFYIQKTYEYGGKTNVSFVNDLFKKKSEKRLRVGELFLEVRIIISRNLEQVAGKRDLTLISLL